MKNENRKTNLKKENKENMIKNKLKIDEKTRKIGKSTKK